eukprot:1102433-Amorphochlora_amoeboformis.AAC.1
MLAREEGERRAEGRDSAGHNGGGHGFGRVGEAVEARRHVVSVHCVDEGMTKVDDVVNRETDDHYTSDGFTHT